MSVCGKNDFVVKWRKWVRIVIVYLFLERVDHVFAWPFETTKLCVSLGERGERKWTYSVGVQSILLYSWLSGEAMTLQVGDLDLEAAATKRDALWTVCLGVFV